MKAAVRTLAVLVASVMLIGGAVVFFSQPPRVTVAPGESVQQAVTRAVPGSTIILAAGSHSGPLVIGKTVTLRGEPGARLVAPTSSDAVLTVAAQDVRVEELALRGGSAGITIREVEGVGVEDVAVSGAELHGIEVVDASAHIRNAVVNDLGSSLAQGIEIRNADGRPDTTVEESRVSGGQEGIVSHVSEVRFIDNEVTGTTMRGIVITEMSDGFVEGNRVSGTMGAGLYCGDMSRCHFESNEIERVAAGTGGRSTMGWGLVVTYHAVAAEFENALDGEAGPTMLSLHGHMKERSPLDPGTLGDVLPAFLIAFLVAVVLCVAGILGARPLGSWLERQRLREELPSNFILVVAVSAVVIQSFHMMEHFIQIYRIHVDHIPSRGGLAGPGVDTEWIHMAYNGSVLLFLVLAVLVLRGRTFKTAATIAMGGVFIQSWHAVEHIAKVVSHVTTGAKVNEGLLGRYVDLAWFHFTINLAVYTLSVAAAGICLWTLYRSRYRAALQPIVAGSQRSL